MPRLLAALIALAVIGSCSPLYACSASYYAYAHHGRTMANGKPFDMNAMTAAHRTYSFGTKVRVTLGSRSVVVTISDRGPAAWTGRCIDLSLAAAQALGMVKRGVADVTITKVR